MHFVPFVAVTVAHLIGLSVSSYIVVHLTKPLLMPALLVALFLGVGVPRTRTTVLTAIALLFSLAGDVMLSMPGDIGFLIGLGCFFVVHLTYLVIFTGPLRLQRVPLAALVLVAWFVGLLALLAPHLGALLVPVAAYGLVLGGAATAALACNRQIALGALTFLVSDTLLAFKLFYPGFTFWQIDVVIMVLYCTGQGLIIYGVTRELTRRRVAAELQVVLA